MFALDLFNNDHERHLAEGAVDQLEQRRIDDLAMKMDDLVARAKTATTPEAKAALVKEFKKCKAERDSYYKISNETMGYGTLVGEENVNEGAMKEWLWKEAERLDLDAFVANAGEYGMSTEEAIEWWNSINGPLDEAMSNKDQTFWSNRGQLWAKFSKVINSVETPEQFEMAKNYARLLAKKLQDGINSSELAQDYDNEQNIKTIKKALADKAQELGIEYMEEAGIPGSVPADKIPGKEDLLKGKGRSYYEDEEPEGETLKNSLHTIIRVATHLDKALKTNEDFPEWVSEKIGAVKELMVGVMDYEISDQEMSHDSDAMEEAGIPGSVPTEKIPGKEDLLKGRGRSYYEAHDQKKNSEEVAEAGGGWALDPKTRLELQKRKNRQKTIAKYAGKNVYANPEWTADELKALGGPRYKDKEIKEAQQLHIGDPIVVTAPNEFEGKTGEISDLSPSGKFVVVNLYNHGRHSMHLSDVEYNQYADKQDEDDWYDDEEVEEGFQDFNKVEPYAVCLAGKPVKKFDYYADARRFHDNWKQKLYREGNQAKADTITLMPLNLDEATNRHFGPRGAGTELARQTRQAEIDRKFNTPDQLQKDADYRNYRAGIKKAKVVAKKSQVKEFAPGGTMKPPAPPTAKKKDPFEDDDRSQLLMSIKNLLDKGAKIDSYLFGARGHITGVSNDYFGFYFKKLNKPHSKSSFVRPMDGEDDESYMLKLVKPGYYQLWDKSIADAGEQGVAEAATDYSKRRQRERDVDTGKPVPKQREPRMTDYQKRRAQQKKEMELGESQDDSGVEQAILHRIMVAHTDLLKQFGPQKVMQAAEEVAYNVGDLDEIGTSDVSAWVYEVKRILGA